MMASMRAAGGAAASATVYAGSLRYTPKKPSRPAAVESVRSKPVAESPACSRSHSNVQPSILESCGSGSVDEAFWVDTTEGGRSAAFALHAQQQARASRSGRISAAFVSANQTSGGGTHGTTPSRKSDFICQKVINNAPRTDTTRDAIEATAGRKAVCAAANHRVGKRGLSK